MPVPAGPTEKTISLLRSVFQIGALGGVAGGDGLLGQGEHDLVTERAAQIRTRIALKELEPLLQIGTLERVPLRSRP